MLKSTYKTEGKHETYNQEQLAKALQKEMPLERVDMGYVRVSSKENKKIN